MHRSARKPILSRRTATASSSFTARRPWHTIIHSLHPDYAVAGEELSRLSADLAALKLCVHSLQKGTKLRVIETGLESSFRSSRLGTERPRKGGLE